MQKDINNQEVEQKDIKLFDVLSQIFKDSKGVYLYKKSEKISKAFFMLTQHIDDSQSIKVKLREGALSLLDKSQMFLLSPRLNEEILKEVVLNVMKLISLSDIGLSSKFVSEANYQIISKQLHIYISEVTEYVNSTYKDNNLIPSTLFDVAFMDQQPTFSKIENKETEISVVKEITKGHVLHSKSQVDNLPKTPVLNTEDHKDSKEKNSRQELILNTIRQRGELSIKDLTDVIKGCSEKTIQRELVSLVTSGVLLKTGERRWSRYSVSD
jgi:hypothetical protein